MSQKPRTQYNPSVGCWYFITNIKTGEKIKATLLTKGDEEHLPFRSPAGTPKGKEFFKMKFQKGKKTIVLKFLNSNQFEKCLTPNAAWEFSGEAANGKKLLKNDEKKEEKIKEQKKIAAIKKKNKVVLTETQIRDDLLNSQYANRDLLKQVIEKLCM